MKLKIDKIAFFIAILILLSILFFNRIRIRIMYEEFRKPKLPEPIFYEEEEYEEIYDSLIDDKIQETNSDINQSGIIADNGDDIATEAGMPSVNDNIGETHVRLLPSEYNLAVPFQPQAPYANWGLPYQEACEEASLIMASAFFNKTDLDAESMDSSIKKLVDWQEKTFGYYKDTTSQEVALIAQGYFNLSVFLDRDVRSETIKSYLSQNKIVVVPAAGRILPNPYFTGEGPLYHMLVIRGYTDDHFITNDPGTKRGEEFLYKYDDLINSIHDWSHDFDAYKKEEIAEKILQGEKILIVIDKK